MAEALPDLPMNETVMVRLLRIAVVGLGHYFEPVFRDIKLSESAFHVLAILVASENGQASPSELSELVGASRANMTRILDELSRDGLIVRSAESQDGRRLTVAVTTKGRKAIKSAVPRLALPLMQAFSGLTHQEFSKLSELLKKAIVSFDKGSTHLDVVRRNRKSVETTAE
jgi:MarR family transcriptional repressor of emrRAB